MKFYSPLRYPGGKNKLAKFVALLCQKNNINGHYVEPYAGGASVALFLLINGYVKDITINDYDRSIYAFWYSVLNHTEKLCKLIENTDVNISNWNKQKEIQKNKSRASILKLGFSTFYLNRVNRSGIINGGVIGGIDQKGNYKIDCRFNKKDLINRIRLIASYKDKISLYNLDAIELIKEIKKKNKNTIFYLDPPYFVRGQSLYMNSYEHRDHKKISDFIKNDKNINWIVSYDDVKEIRKLYENFRQVKSKIIYTAYEIREGKEILFFSNNLKIPLVDNLFKVCDTQLKTV